MRDSLKRPDTWLVAAMRAGAHVLRVAHGQSDEHGDDGVTSVCTYVGHESESLTYGADWCMQDEREWSTVRICTCSFYDRAVHVWSMVHVVTDEIK